MELRFEEVLKLLYIWQEEVPEETSQQRQALYESLCREAIEGVQRCLKEEIEQLHCYLMAVEALSAAQALYDLVLLDSALTPETLASSEVRIQQGERVQKARLLVEEKRRAALPVLMESGFYFGRA